MLLQANTLSCLYSSWCTIHSSPSVTYQNLVFIINCLYHAYCQMKPLFNQPIIIVNHLTWILIVLMSLSSSLTPRILIIFIVPDVFILHLTWMLIILIVPTAHPGASATD